MPENQNVIDVMRKAVGEDPSNISIRLHLIHLLVEEKEASEALGHAESVLSSQPDNTLALDYAAQACRILGDNSKAASYERLYTALTGAGQTKKETVPPETPAEVSAEYDDDFNGDFDANNEFEEAEYEAPGDDQKIKISDSGYFSESILADDGEAFWEIEKPELKIADVAGMHAVKKRLDLSFLAPLKNPEMMQFYGKNLRGGLLLYGPPGCGKTFIARAVAGELGAKFFSVGLSDVLDMWIGNSEKNIHEIFQTARRNSPCVLFFDELDALGRKRILTRHGGVSNVVNQLLMEMDSIQSDNEGIFILAATNHPWDVDNALRRPGRLDRMLLVLPPDPEAREAILKFHMKGRPADKIDYAGIAKNTSDFSGADLAYLCEAAAEHAMEESLASGKVRKINTADFKNALSSLRPSTLPWYETAKNFALFANEGGIYDDLVAFLKKKRLI